MNLCNNLAEVKDANLGQQRAYIHFCYLFSCKSNEIGISAVTQTLTPEVHTGFSCIK